jgi:hypothetical protein
MYPTQRTELRELDRRTHDGIDVSLWWDPRTKGVSVAVTDTRGGGSFEFGVEPGDALKAFWHPYAYIAPGDTGDVDEAWSRRTRP